MGAVEIGNSWLCQHTQLAAAIPLKMAYHRPEQALRRNFSPNSWFVDLLRCTESLFVNNPITWNRLWLGTTWLLWIWCRWQDSPARLEDVEGHRCAAAHIALCLRWLSRHVWWNGVQTLISNVPWYQKYAVVNTDLAHFCKMLLTSTSNNLWVNVYLGLTRKKRAGGWED